MLITISGVSGVGKSFFKKEISRELGVKNLSIVTTRKIRKNEVNGIDKEFVNDEEFEKLKLEGKIQVAFEFLGSKYAYRTENLQSNENQVTEVHYSTIYELKKCAKNVFSIYIIPKDIERAKEEIRKRESSEEVIEKRLKEIDEHIKEYNTNQDLRNQFDYVFVNDYTEESRIKLLNVIKEKLNNVK
jgi:guanylate kinase